ncbi:MAG: hypothetical protein RLZZ450_2001 [Pseudomonadota bacterium]|jgi:hypothetical protein
MEQELRVDWEPCPPEQAEEVLAALVARHEERFTGWRIARARRAGLSFYREHVLVQLELARDDRLFRVFALSASEPKSVRWLDGSLTPLHDANESEVLSLSARTLLDYVRFFLFFLRAEEGAFTLLEAGEELKSSVLEAGELAALRAHVKRLEEPRDGALSVQAVLAYGGGLFSARLVVSAQGRVEMTDDERLASLASVVFASAPDLDTAFGPQPARLLPSELAARRGVLFGEHDPGFEDVASKDRDVTETVLGVLLAEAVRAREGHTLLRRFNARTRSDDAIAKLARFVKRSFPIVIVESDLPFAEELVASILTRAQGITKPPTVVRASASEDDPTRARLELGVARSDVFYTLSFQAYRSLWDGERVAHELSLRDTATLIGCARASDVPEPLRKVADLTLTLPPIDASVYAEIFTRLFAAPPPAGWDRYGDDWTRHLTFSDFYAPHRLRLSPEQAAASLHQRVLTRLGELSVDDAPSLAELHGLGPARAVIESLVRDVETSTVPRDRALLLVGERGAGKAELARAIAHDLGLRWVHLPRDSFGPDHTRDAVLSTLRASFSEARRFAPALLYLAGFEALAGDQEVLACFRDQLARLNNEQVIVVAGSAAPSPLFERVAYVPYPSIVRLESFIADALESLQQAGQVSASVDPRALAALSFGLTGREVEGALRTSLRTARAQRRLLGQQDLAEQLAAEPRPAKLARLAPRTLRRTAVREAGYALARLLSASDGADIAFVSVIPRHDGGLGFTAEISARARAEHPRFVARASEGGPRPTTASARPTHRGRLEWLEIVLAGRAAEEVIYGADDLGLDPLGDTEGSDLALATHVATELVCKSGLGGEGDLLWTDSPTRAQLDRAGVVLKLAYRAILGRLRGNRAQLEQLADALVEQQELSGDELRVLLARPRLTLPKEVATGPREVGRPKRAAKKGELKLDSVEARPRAREQSVEARPRAREQSKVDRKAKRTAEPVSKLHAIGDLRGRAKAPLKKSPTRSR